MAGHELGAFAALADGTRRDIVSRLTLGDATVGELAAV
jgi:DNA-binding transcriptional ArsR family regulator